MLVEPGLYRQLLGHPIATAAVAVALALPVVLAGQAVAAMALVMVSVVPAQLAIPAVAVPLLQDDCIDTTVDIDWVWDYIHLTSEDKTRRLNLNALHEEVRRLGGAVTHLSRMWNYADAVRHPKPQREAHGLKLIPPRSGVMLNPDGRRYGPVPVMPTFDAYSALERMCEDERKYSWLILYIDLHRRTWHGGKLYRFLRYKCFIFSQGVQIGPLPQRDQRLTRPLHRRGNQFRDAQPDDMQRLD